MSYLIEPSHYKPLLNAAETEQGIKVIKEFFADNLSTGLRLRRVTAPLFVRRGLGLNDDLSGTERAVTFPIKDLGDAQAEVVHSLAKWKRLTLAEYAVPEGYGIYTDMNAIRADEELGNLHSLYVDQWDWERVIAPADRTIDFLKKVVRCIYEAMLRTEYLTFLHAEELRQRYPSLSSKQRENAIAEELGAVFIIGIGGPLGDGKPHDLRAPDYDDYSSPSSLPWPGLNGDLLVWNAVLGRAFELSSMGIRVDREALLRQLRESDKDDRQQLYFHQRLLNGTLPLSVGGGIGQSRLCMYYLQKAHIGEIQASIWPDEMRSRCRELGIPLI